MELLKTIGEVYLWTCAVGVTFFLIVWGPAIVRFLWAEFGKPWLTAFRKWWLDRSGDLSGLFLVVTVLGLLLFGLIVTA